MSYAKFRLLIAILLRLGLKNLIAKDEQLPDLFSDSLYVRSSHWALSTSAIFSKHFDAYGWGEVVSDGFGVAYMTGFDGIYSHCLPFECNY